MKRFVANVSCAECGANGTITPSTILQMGLFRKDTSLKEYYAELECIYCSGIGSATVIARGRRSAMRLLKRHIRSINEQPHERGFIAGRTCDGEIRMFTLEEVEAVLDQDQLSEGVTSFEFNP